MQYKRQPSVKKWLYACFETGLSRNCCRKWVAQAWQLSRTRLFYIPWNNSSPQTFTQIYELTLRIGLVLNLPGFLHEGHDFSPFELFMSRSFFLGVLKVAYLILSLAGFLL